MIEFICSGQRWAPGYASSFQGDFVATVPDNIHLSHRPCARRRVPDDAILGRVDYAYCDE